MCACILLGRRLNLAELSFCSHDSENEGKFYKRKAKTDVLEAFLKDFQVPQKILRPFKAFALVCSPSHRCVDRSVVAAA
jgi:hypothetical protein